MSELHKCISCEREETIIPLVSIRFSKIPTWICTQCLPTLIHNPAKLESKFRDMDVENPVKPKIN
ncbi:MAG: hypothetical protein IPM32_17610 [Ignavibacteriae bacterium]|nr:hypothetical protein [Ignavibacteriota bacterium]